jgi:hypothetical protein
MQLRKAIIPQAGITDDSTRYEVWRLVRRVIVGVLVLMVVLWGGAALILHIAQTSIQYPGSIQSQASTSTRFYNTFTIRRDAVYRSTDPFSKVYSWYSVGFELGPERHANGTCILMARTRPLFPRVDQNMSVMLCDTPNDRMAFVTRSFIVRYPDWVKQLRGALQAVFR